MKFFCLLIFFVSYSFSSVLVAGEGGAAKAKELANLQKKIKRTSEKLNALKIRKNSLQSDLRRLDTQYGESVNQLKQLQEQVEKLKHSLITNQQQIRKKQQEIDSQKDALEHLIKIAYGMGKNKKLRLLLSQQDPSSVGRMIVYYDFLNKARLEKIASIDKDMQFLRDLKLKRLKETELLKEKVSNTKLEQSALVVTKIERKAVLNKINRQFASKRQQLSRFKANEKRLRTLLSTLDEALEDPQHKEYFENQNNKAFAKLKNKLPWPVSGKLAKKFGAKRSDSRWDGVLIQTSEGKEIRAVSKGRVVYADWFRGYGLLTIIDHGAGYMTLYAFNQNLYKNVGDQVVAGSVIATVGQSGGQLDAGLYFGIRKKGKPVNPEKWCRKIRHGKVG